MVLFASVAIVYVVDPVTFAAIVGSQVVPLSGEYWMLYDETVNPPVDDGAVQLTTICWLETAVETDAGGGGTAAGVA